MVKQNKVLPIWTVNMPIEATCCSYKKFHVISKKEIVASVSITSAYTYLSLSNLITNMWYSRHMLWLAWDSNRCQKLLIHFANAAINILCFFFPDQMKILLPHIKHVPEDLQDRLVDDVCEYLYDISPKRPDGMVHGEVGPYDYLLIVATK